MTEKEQDESDSKPPFFNSWKSMYIFILVNLAITILIFWLITIYFK
jgi:hypothetical protein